MGGGLRRFSPIFQMVQNLFDDDWVFDAGNHLDRAATLLTGFDIDLENGVEALRPGHGGVGLSGCPGFVILPAGPVSPVGVRRC